MQTWAAVWSHSNPLMHPLVSVSLYLQTAKEADDEEAAVGGKKDKRKPPAGRGPYRVAIMLTGGSLLFLVHAHRAAHWPTDPNAACCGACGLDSVCSNLTVQHPCLLFPPPPRSRRGRQGDECGGPPRHWHGRHTQQHGWVGGRGQQAAHECA